MNIRTSAARYAVLLAGIGGTFPWRPSPWTWVAHRSLSPRNRNSIPPTPTVRIRFPPRAWFQEFKRDVSNERPIPIGTKCLSVRKSPGTIHAQWSGSWTRPIGTGTPGPFRWCAARRPPDHTGHWAYNPASSGPYLLPPEPVVYEGRLQTLTRPRSGPTAPTTTSASTSATKPPALPELWEYYQPWVTRSGNRITAVAGASWRKFDFSMERSPRRRGGDGRRRVVDHALGGRYDEVRRVRSSPPCGFV